VQRATKLRILDFLAPVILGVGFLIKMLYIATFAWWLGPLLERKANRELVDDIKTNLDFLVSDPNSIRVLSADWPTVEVSWSNLLLTVVRWRGDTNVSIAPRHAPVESYELGPLVAAFESRHFSERDIVNDLVDAAKLLRPRLQALNAAFSEQEFPRIKQRL
jgi:hypothetical protein